MAHSHNAPSTTRQTRKQSQVDTVPKSVAAKKVKAKAKAKAKPVLEAATIQREVEISTVEREDNALKRTHNDGDGDHPLIPASKRARKTSRVETVTQGAHSPAPSARRSARVQAKTPVVEKKRKRRTKQEIAADKARAEEEKKKQEELTIENERILAEMNLAEDIDRVAAMEKAIRSFSELDADSELGEEFVGIDDVVGSDDEADGEIDDAVDLEQLKKTHKAMQDKIRALENQVSDGRKKNARGGNNKSPRKTKPTFASGLRSDWNGGTGTKKAAEKPSNVQISVGLGGLHDSDAEDTNPFLDLPSSAGEPSKKGGIQTLGRDFSRKNEMLAIVVDATSKETKPRRASKATTARMATSKKASNTTAPTKVKTSQKPTLKQEQGDHEIAEKGREKRFSGNNVRIADLPAFATKKWRDTFLPTLYDRFFSSSNPFGDFCVGTPVFVQILQEIVEEVYPDVQYTVTSSDSLHFLAYNRINEKRSSIGSSAIKLLEVHINTLGGEKAAKEWLRWCIWPGGPLLFEAPSPFRSTEPPEGRLLSPFIITLARPLLKLKEGSTSEHKPPQGLIALIAAALERAARHLYNPKNKPTEFSKDIWGSCVEAYWKSFQPDPTADYGGIEPERWAELVKRCCASPEDEKSDQEMFDADLSFLDDKRPLIFNFQSPSKLRR